MKNDQSTTGVVLTPSCSEWRDITTAPRDGTPFVWMHYITIIYADRPHEYKPYVDILRRMWVNEETAGRIGNGFWMGQYGSKSDDEADRGYWMPLHPAPNDRDQRRGHAAADAPKTPTT